MITQARSILVVAAHPDDEVLGCGGTIARCADAQCDVHVLIAAEGITSRGAQRGNIHGEKLSALAEAAEKANKALGSASLSLMSLPDNRMDGVELLDVVKMVEEAVAHHMPSLVLTHHGGDVNVDHRLLHEAVITACRPQPGFPVKQVMFFEVPSSTEWRPAASALPFAPNLFVDIGAYLDRKLKALAAYHSEMRDFPHPRSVRAVEHLARWRGATVGCAAAEAFVVGRMII